LNVGEEELKGNDAVRGAGAQLRGGMTPIRFHGFIEGDDIAAGTVDVVVTDGLHRQCRAEDRRKASPSCFSESLRASFRHSPLARIGYVFARGALKKLAARLDPRRYNGGDVPRPGRHRGEKPWLDRRVRLRQRDQRRDRPEGQRLPGKDPRTSWRSSTSCPRRSNRPRCNRAPMMFRSQYCRLRAPNLAGARSSPMTSSPRGSIPPDAWIRQRTGIGERRIAAAGELTSDLAFNAAHQALERAGMNGNDLDLIVLATATPDQTFPATAVRCRRASANEAGAPRSTCRRCAPALSSRWAVADNALRLGQARTALVIGAETFSRILDWQDRGTCVLFGDGARGAGC